MNIKEIHSTLVQFGVDITGYYKETEYADSGFEIANKYVVQFAPYCSPPLYLDNLDMSFVAEFETPEELASYLIKK